MEILRRNDRLGLRLELDPSADRRFRVVADDEVVYATNVESSANVEYDEIFEVRDRPFAEHRKREQDFKVGERIRAETVARTSGKAARSKGGKGGRGGV